MRGRDLDLHGPHEEMQIKVDAEEIAGRRRTAWEGVGFSAQSVLRTMAAWSWSVFTDDRVGRRGLLEITSAVQRHR